MLAAIYYKRQAAISVQCRLYFATSLQELDLQFLKTKVYNSVVLSAVPLLLNIQQHYLPFNKIWCDGPFKTFLLKLIKQMVCKSRAALWLPYQTKVERKTFLLLREERRKRRESISLIGCIGWNQPPDWLARSETRLESTCIYWK